MRLGVFWFQFMVIIVKLQKTLLFQLKLLHAVLHDPICHRQERNFVKPKLVAWECCRYQRAGGF